MQNKISTDLEERFIAFSVAVIKFAQTEPSLPFSVVDQVIRASASIGANYAEAQNASSRADFRNKIFIAKKEAAESRYWLRVIAKLSETNRTEGLISEVQEIVLILQKIISKLREKEK